MNKLIIELPQWQYENIKTMTHKSNPVDIGVMINAMTSIANGVVIPYNATNGDIVEVIFGKGIYHILLRHMYAQNADKLTRWWNAPYKENKE